MQAVGGGVLLIVSEVGGEGCIFKARNTTNQWQMVALTPCFPC